MKTMNRWTCLAAIACIAGWSLAAGGQLAWGQQANEQADQPPAAEATDQDQPEQQQADQDQPEQQQAEQDQPEQQQPEQQQPEQQQAEQQQQAGQQQADPAREGQQQRRQAQDARQPQQPERAQQDQRAGQQRQTLGVQFDTSQEGGLTIQEIQDDSLAAQAGLQQGDQIIEVGGRRVKNPGQFNAFIRGMQGQTVPVVVMRDGQRETVQLNIREQQQIGQAREGQQGRRPGLGVTFDGTRQGVWVKEVVPQSPADEAGLQPGDQVLAINGRQYNDARSAAMAIRQMQPGSEVDLNIRRQDETQQVSAQLETWDSAFAQREQGQQRQPGQPLDGRYGQRQTVLRPDIDQQQQLEQMQQELQSLRQEVQELRRTVMQLRAGEQPGAGTAPDDIRRAPDAGAIIEGEPGERQDNQRQDNQRQGGQTPQAPGQAAPAPGAPR